MLLKTHDSKLFIVRLNCLKECSGLLDLGMVTPAQEYTCCCDSTEKYIRVCYSIEELRKWCQL